MRKIESLFITIGLFSAIGVCGGVLWHNLNKPTTPEVYEFPSSEFGDFLAAQHAVYINDFNNAQRFAQSLGDVQIPVVQNTVYIAEFLGGKMPTDVHLLKGEKSLPAQLIYDAYLVKNNKWKELHNRHKTDESALAAPLRIWSAIANDWRTNTLKFIDKLPTNESWKSFVRGQIWAELGDVDKAAEHFAAVSPDFMNINDYLYIMSFYEHHGFYEDAQILKTDFTARPGGMFMADFDDIPDWSVYSGYENALAFSLVQNVSHTQVMMYSDLAMLLLRFAEITAPEFAKNSDAIKYYLGNYFYNNVGDYETFFRQINSDSPFYLFGVLRMAEKSGDVSELIEVLDEHPLFVPAVNKVVAHHIKNGNKRAALRVVNRAIDNDSLDEVGRAFFVKSRAHIHFAFGNLNAAQDDIRMASDVLLMDNEIMALQAKIWAEQNRELENAYQYAMNLVQQNPADVFAWDTLGLVVAKREGVWAALEVLARVGEVADDCSSLFVHLGDLYVAKGDDNKAIDAYKRAIELADDGLTVVPDVERKIRKLK